MAAARVLLGLALIVLGMSLMTGRAADHILDAERRLGTDRQRQAADTPGRRKQVRLFNGLVGLTFVGFGVLTALMDG